MMTPPVIWPLSSARRSGRQRPAATKPLRVRPIPRRRGKRRSPIWASRAEMRKSSPAARTSSSSPIEWPACITRKSPLASSRRAIERAAQIVRASVGATGAGAAGVAVAGAGAGAGAAAFAGAAAVRGRTGVRAGSGKTWSRRELPCSSAKRANSSIPSDDTVSRRKSAARAPQRRATPPRPRAVLFGDRPAQALTASGRRIFRPVPRTRAARAASGPRSASRPSISGGRSARGERSPAARPIALKAASRGSVSAASKSNRTSMSLPPIEDLPSA